MNDEPIVVLEGIADIHLSVKRQDGRTERYRVIVTVTELVTAITEDGQHRLAIEGIIRAPEPQAPPHRHEAN